MKLENKKIGFAFDGSTYTFEKTLLMLKELKKHQYIEIFPIINFSNNLNYRVIREFISKIEKIVQNKVIYNKEEIMNNYSAKIFDILLVAPCSDYTLSNIIEKKFNTNILFSINSSINYNKPVVLGISTQNILSGSIENIGKLMKMKNYYFIPFRQSNPITRPNFLAFDFNYVKKTLEFAIDKTQIQPILL